MIEKNQKIRKTAKTAKNDWNSIKVLIDGHRKSGMKNPKMLKSRSTRGHMGSFVVNFSTFFGYSRMKLKVSQTQLCDHHACKVHVLMNLYSLIPPRDVTRKIGNQLVKNFIISKISKIKHLLNHLRELFEIV